MLEKGYIQVYTGDGKGKTTAALGLTLRALGAGLRVFIGQFVKGMEYSELESLKQFGNKVVIERFGRKCFIKNKPEKEDIEYAKKGILRIIDIIKSGDFDIVILDEISIALYYNLINLSDVIKIIKERPPKIELVLTGRKMPNEIIKLADLVTEMKEVKHYYQKGVEARKGIES